MKILITGATGLIGQTVVQQLPNDHQIFALTRQVETARQKLPEHVNILTELPTADEFNFDAVLNLAGEPIADKRWTERQKNKICQSRWQLTQTLAERIIQCPEPPAVFISGSAVGYYGRQPNDKIIDEDYAAPYPEFSHRLCKKWEELALTAANQTRVCLIRTGLVLARQGGLLKKMNPVFKLGLGGAIASGQQMMSWIHLDDEVNAILFLLKNERCHGVYNLTAPEAVNNKTFSQVLAKRHHRKTFLATPEWLLRLVFADLADLLVYGQAVYPARLKAEGFTFKYTKLNQALAAC
ncbi:TIGR01777 family oxidoreductase [Gayadomonas joobiniege]|uniref:TIGR01777 family oxidoreductase n=1 Tax=Gayadomonas joobiniege TaxID=1234606 RepID=UPI00037F9904|nr:TIGR01777 family oxidoreductase [Gayadomonas joobiniege]